MEGASKTAGRLVQVVVTLLALSLVAGYLTTIYFGAGFAVVEGTSMEPLFHTGDLVALWKKPPQDIEVGDIVVFRSGSKHVIHRVVYKYVGPNGEYCFVTKGDNNVLPDLGDPRVCGSRVAPGLGVVTGRPFEDIVGVVVEINDIPVKIPYVGMFRLVADKLIDII
ncbi:MAG: signal peptidase I [Desulfurococcales archaeon]|nr:signal peptidase I [Desulfurococcales archaeon]